MFQSAPDVMNLLKDLFEDLIGNAKKRGLLNYTASAAHNI